MQISQFEILLYYITNVITNQCVYIKKVIMTIINMTIINKKYWLFCQKVHFLILSEDEEMTLRDWILAELKMVEKDVSFGHGKIDTSHNSIVNNHDKDGADVYVKWISEMLSIYK